MGFSLTSQQQKIIRCSHGISLHVAECGVLLHVSHGWFRTQSASRACANFLIWSSFGTLRAGSLKWANVSEWWSKGEAAQSTVSLSSLLQKWLTRIHLTYTRKEREREERKPQRGAYVHHRWYYMQPNAIKHHIQYSYYICTCLLLGSASLQF